MGDRANVAIKAHQSTVYLYTHWGREDLPETLRRALAKRWRWNDAPYLSRIIFCEMVKGSETGETGFGIWTSPCDGADRVLIVDMEAQTVSWRDVPLPLEQYVALEVAEWSSFRVKP